MPNTFLSLFPLATVLYPGVVLPLHIFEARYRQLIRDLVEQEDGPRAFGVVAIKEGRETGGEGVTALHDVGCTAVLQQVQAYPDGSMDIVAIGQTRFKVMDLDFSSDLVRAQVEMLTDDFSNTSPLALTVAVSRSFRTYRTAIARAQGIDDLEEIELPTDALDLSFVIATAMVLDVSEKQRLLAAATATQRLQLEHTLLRRELLMVEQLSVRPAVELPRAPYSSN